MILGGKPGYGKAVHWSHNMYYVPYVKDLVKIYLVKKIKKMREIKGFRV